MSPELLLFAALAGLCGGFINGFSGTGTALFGLGFLLVPLDPPQAVLVIALVAVIAGLQGLWAVRATIPGAKARILTFMLPGLLGLPLGLMSLKLVSAENLRFLIALFLIAYGAFFGLRRALPTLSGITRVHDGAVGFCSGVLGGLASLSGTLPLIWLSMRDWPKTDIRAVMQSFNFVMLSLTAFGLTLSGAFTREAALALAVAVPAGILAARVGIWTFQRTPETLFRRALILLCLAMGLGMLASSL